MKQSKFAIFMVVLSVGCGKLGACAAQDEWRAFMDHGDKPGIAFVLHVKDNVLSGEFYITSPDDYKNLSTGLKYAIQDLKSDGTVITGSVSILDKSSTSGKQEIKLHLKFETPLKGEKVNATFSTKDDDEGQKLVFERANDGGK